MMLEYVAGVISVLLCPLTHVPITITVSFECMRECANIRPLPGAAAQLTVVLVPPKYPVTN